MNAILIWGGVFLASIFGMSFVLFLRLRREKNEGVTERLPREKLLYTIGLYRRKLISHIAHILRKTLSFLKKKVHPKGASFLSLLRLVFLRQMGKIENALSGKAHIAREASSQYLRDISNHKEEIQKRLSPKPQEELLD